jgi:peptidoglycan/LPS O-acetylase OafA/YrhL
VETGAATDSPAAAPAFADRRRDYGGCAVADRTAAAPQRSARLPLFDSLRAIAVIAVVVFHAAPPAGELASQHPLRAVLSRLDAGVWVFFVISGVLLYRPFVAARLRGGPSLAVGAYAWRRALRIIPAYWVALTVITIWRSHPGVFTPNGIPTYYGFLQTYSTAASIRGHGLGQAWSLCVEAAFYAFLPCYALALRRLPGRSPRARLNIEMAGIAVLIAVSVVWKLVVVTSLGEPLGWTPALCALPVYLDVFAVGMGLAVLHAWHEQTGALPRPLRILDGWPSAAWLLALAAFYVVTTQIGLYTIKGYTRAEWVERHVLNTVIGLGIVLPAVVGNQRRGVVRRLLANRVLLYIGMISYGIFLYQGAVLEQLTIWGVGAPHTSHRLLVWVAATLAGTGLIAIVSWYCLEQPMLRLKSRVPLRRRRTLDLPVTAQGEPALAAGER